MQKEELHDELISIRSMMERSSKFISLSGLSGILAGVYALIGAGFAYYILYTGSNRNLNSDFPVLGYLQTTILLEIAVLVLMASLVTGVFLTMRKAKQKGQPIWGKTSRALLFQMAVPLVTGGIFILLLLSRGDLAVVAPASLVFYGLALIGASNFTFNDVKFLGIGEIILGLIAACYPGYGLLFWAIGFGILHIIYGSVMYLKYDR
jgi:hypothetical protein